MGVPYAEVIGDPIAHSKSPTIHKFWLAQTHRSGDYRATSVKADDLPSYFSSRRADPAWRGCNVTMPLKSVVVEQLDDLSDEAKQLGAVNCIVPGERLFGTNFDSQAVLQSLVGREWHGPAVILGSGGAARAALWAASLLGFDNLVVMSRDLGRAQAMTEELGVKASVSRLEGSPECMLLINATPLGMVGYPDLPIDLDNIVAGGTVLDMVYAPLETPLLAAARRRGLAIVDGLTILIEQAAMSFVNFFHRAVTEKQRIEVRQALVQ